MNTRIADVYLTLSLLYGDFPKWFPLPAQQRVTDIVDTLRGDGFSPSDIVCFVDAAAIPDSLVVPSLVRDPIPFIKNIHWLAHFRYALSLGAEKGLLLIAGENAVMGIRFRGNQSDKGSLPRGKIGDDGETIGEIIGLFAKSIEHKEESTKELWYHFYSELDQRVLNPEESIHPVDIKKDEIKYDFGGGRKSITFGQFSNVVSEYRTGKKSG